MTTPTAPAPVTVVDALRRHAASAPDRTALRTVSFDGGEPVVEELSYGALDLAARRLAAWLQGRCEPGDRVLLAHPDGLAFMTAFVGCLYAGVVPLHPAVPRRGKQAGPVLAAVRDAGVSLVLTTAARRERTVDLLRDGDLDALPCVPTDVPGDVPTDAPGDVPGDVPGDADPAGWRPPVADPAALAFLQYTSGSTDDPKGVMITHGALAHNARAIVDLADGRSDETYCGWLPLHHDMGLVGQFLAPLHAGGTTVMMSPADFVRHPLRWLRLVDRYGAGYTAVPNFALDLCCLRVTPEQAAELDLSSLKVVLTGAEPVDARSLAAFAERFAVSGLRPEALRPGYGLAESTLMVTASPRGTLHRTAAVGSGDGDGEVLVSCGPARSGRVEIVDPQTLAVLPEGQVGEIWVAGPSVGAGYWNRPELTEATFGARTADGEGPFLRTGDLGALQDGELYVTGRLKELIVLRGRNISPHETERVVSGLHPAFEGLAAAVFAAPGRGEELVVVQEVRPSSVDRAELPGICRTVREAVGDALGITVPNVVLVAAGSVLRTTSGKVKRLAMREEFLAGRLRVVHEELSPGVLDRRRRAPASVPGPAAPPAGQPAGQPVAGPR